MPSSCPSARPIGKAKIYRLLAMGKRLEIFGARATRRDTSAAGLVPIGMHVISAQAIEYIEINRLSRYLDRDDIPPRSAEVFCTRNLKDGGCYENSALGLEHYQPAFGKPHSHRRNCRRAGSAESGRRGHLSRPRRRACHASLAGALGCISGG